MTAIDSYQRWYSNPTLDEGLRRELQEIAHHSGEIEDRFARELEFGTGGLRGKLGAGTNRMNLYTVGKATQGLAQYLNAKFSLGHPEKSHLTVVIAHDSRHFSPEFAQHAALVLAANGIRAYLFDSLRPTPLLSFAVRYLHASAGIVITASHNPPEYNGYKVYGRDGGQILTDEANAIIQEIRSVSDEFSVPVLSAQEAKARELMVRLGGEVDRAYLDELKRMAIPDLSSAARANLKIVYTPLHGAGNVLVQNILRETGYSQLHVVAAQEKPDPNFSTVTSPNPEEKQAFTLAIELAQEIDADVILGTDPDADRVGVVVRNSQGEFVPFTGNQTGGLLLNFLLHQHQQAGTLPSNGVIFKTIVTSEFGREVADLYGIETENTLTGFKYIAERVNEYETSVEKKFLFGYEESYGYLIAPFVRDKDAVQACLMLAEMAAYYHEKGINLYEALQELFERVGYYQEELVSVTLPGEAGLKQIGTIMTRLRSQPDVVEDWKLVRVEDYQRQTALNLETGDTHTLSLPVSDVLKFFYQDGSWIAIRPSGTEPKLKLYLGVKGRSGSEAADKLHRLSQAAKQMLE